MSARPRCCRELATSAGPFKVGDLVRFRADAAEVYRQAKGEFPAFCVGTAYPLIPVWVIEATKDERGRFGGANGLRDEEWERVVAIHSPSGTHGFWVRIAALEHAE